jgi:hypothetical protein
MVRHGLRPWLAAILLGRMLFLVVVAQAGEPTSKQQLAEATEKVRTAATSLIRDEAARHLAELTRTIDPKQIDDKTITDLVSLLDSAPGRYWVAMSLGNVGPRAKIAIPKLKQLLAEEECRRVSKSAADGFRYALRRMGVVPPLPICETDKK